MFRVNFETLPAHMRKLPLHPEWKVPVPWFVDYVDGKPEFRAMDRRKFIRALKDKLCWTCGEPLGRYLAFVIGPMCAVTRTTSEPPNHYDCARWSVENCPFLSNPEMVRRTEGLPAKATMENVAGIAILRNPGVSVIWVTRGYERFRDEKGMYLLTVGAPERIEWYREGRVATRDEVQASLDSGLPNLLTVAKSEGAFAVEALGKQVQAVERWMPAA